MRWHHRLTLMLRDWIGWSRRERELGGHRGLMLAATGTAVGLALAIAVARGMQSLLFSIQPGDVVSFAAAAAAVWSSR